MRSALKLFSFRENYSICAIFYNVITKNMGISLYYTNKDREAIRRINRRKKIRKILDELKINGCARCGYNICTSSLDFHHINPEDKKFRLNFCGINEHTDNEIIEEIYKCMLLCRNCHGEIEYGN